MLNIHLDGFNSKDILAFFEETFSHHSMGTFSYLLANSIFVFKRTCLLCWFRNNASSFYFSWASFASFPLLARRIFQLNAALSFPHYEVILLKWTLIILLENRVLLQRKLEVIYFHVSSCLMCLLWAGASGLVLFLHEHFFTCQLLFN